MSKKEQIQTNNTPPVIIQKKKRGCGFFSGFFVCLIFILLCVGGFGAYVYFGVTLNQIESIVGTKLPIDGDIRNKPVKDLLKLAFETKDSYVHMTINDVDKKLGINLPQKIPGTTIDITSLYDEKINFKGREMPVKTIEVMEIVNNFDAFIQSLLPVLYKNISVDEILTTAKLKDTIIKMGYPALVDKIYNLGTEAAPIMKNFSELKINELQKILVDYYGSENLTVQKMITAIGLQSIIPDKIPGKQDLYAGLRDLKLTKMSTNDLMSNINGELASKFVDLNSFKFAKTDEFKKTTLNNMLAYLQSVKLNQMIDIPTKQESAINAADKLLYALRNVDANMILSANPMDKILALIDSNDGWINFKVSDLVDPSVYGNILALSNTKIVDLIRDSTTTLDNIFQNIQLGEFLVIDAVVEDNFFVNNPEFNSLKNIKLSQFVNGVYNLRINKILTPLQLSESALTEEQKNMSIPQLLLDYSTKGNNTITLLDIFGTENITFFGGYLYELKDANITDFKTKFEALSLQQIIGSTNKLNSIANLSDITLSTLLKDPNSLNTILNKFGTIGELCGNSTEGIMKVIGPIKISDLLNNPNIIMQTIQNNTTTTLGQLLNISTSDGIVSEIVGIKIGELFTNANTAITNKLNNSTTSLAQLLNITDTSGIMSILKDITVGELFTDASGNINKALKNSSITLATLLNIPDTQGGIINIIKNITVGNLFTDAGKSINDALAQSDMTLTKLIGLESPTGMVGTITNNISVKDLFGNDPNTALNNAINLIKLSDVFGSVGAGDTILKSILAKNPNATINNISTAMSGLRLADVLGCYTYTSNGDDDVFTLPTEGVFALFTQEELNTSVNNLKALTFDLNKITITKLIEVGVLTGAYWNESPFNKESTSFNSKLEKTTVDDILIYALKYDCDKDHNNTIDTGFTGNVIIDYISSLK